MGTNSSKNESLAKNLFRERMQALGNEESYIESQINLIFPTDGGFVERFNILEENINDVNLYDSILISGSAVGSELFVASQRGFKDVYGTEVLKLYEEVTNARFGDYKNITAITISGVELPFESEKFSTIMSGHIIEHTMAPEKYLVEHFRVLKKGGLFYLEYPDRYHSIELHTNTKSYEHLPFVWRWIALNYLSSPLNKEKDLRFKYKSVLNTLLPVSLKDIERWLAKNKIKYEIIYTQTPYEGVKRIIMKKL